VHDGKSYSGAPVCAESFGLWNSEINERFKLGHYAISTLNSVLWDKDVTKGKKKCIYNTIIKVLPHMGVKFRN
jgi:hypothetical protein